MVAQRRLVRARFPVQIPGDPVTLRDHAPIRSTSHPAAASSDRVRRGPPDELGSLRPGRGRLYTWVQNNDANWDYGSNYLPPTDCLQNIGTGFELWNDGYNLASQGTWINLTTSNASPSPSPSASASPTGS